MVRRASWAGRLSCSTLLALPTPVSSQAPAGRAQRSPLPQGPSPVCSPKSRSSSEVRAPTPLSFMTQLWKWKPLLCPSISLCPPWAYLCSAMGRASPLPGRRGPFMVIREGDLHLHACSSVGAGTVWPGFQTTLTPLLGTLVQCATRPAAHGALNERETRRDISPEGPRNIIPVRHRLNSDTSRGRANHRAKHLVV